MALRGEKVAHERLALLPSQNNLAGDQLDAYIDTRKRPVPSR